MWCPLMSELRPDFILFIAECVCVSVCVCICVCVCVCLHTQVEFLCVCVLDVDLIKTEPKISPLISNNCRCLHDWY